jgi:hypothetical protein
MDVWERTRELAGSSVEGLGRLTLGHPMPSTRPAAVQPAAATTSTRRRRLDQPAR